MSHIEYGARVRVRLTWISIDKLHLLGIYYCFNPNPNFSFASTQSLCPPNVLCYGHIECGARVRVKLTWIFIDKLHLLGIYYCFNPNPNPNYLFALTQSLCAPNILQNFHNLRISEDWKLRDALGVINIESFQIYN